MKMFLIDPNAASLTSTFYGVTEEPVKNSVKIGMEAGKVIIPIIAFVWGLIAIFLLCTNKIATKMKVLVMIIVTLIVSIVGLLVYYFKI